MADSERTEHLKRARAEMAEKRVFLIGRLIDDDAVNSEEIFAVIEASLLNTQQVIEAIDQAIADEIKSQGSVYQRRGLIGS